MKILNLNISSEDLVKEVKATYLTTNFLANCKIFKVEIINGLEELKSLITKFKKFDQLSVAQQISIIIK